MGYVFDMASKDVPRCSQGLQKDAPGGDFWVRGEYLRWFPPFSSRASAGLSESPVWDPTARLGHM